MIDGRPHAIEVELTMKAERRLDAIVSELCARLRPGRVLLRARDAAPGRAARRERAVGEPGDAAAARLPTRSARR